MLNLYCFMYIVESDKYLENQSGSDGLLVL